MKEEWRKENIPKTVNKQEYHFNFLVVSFKDPNDGITSRWLALIWRQWRVNKTNQCRQVQWRVCKIKWFINESMPPKSLEDSLFIIIMLANNFNIVWKTITNNFKSLSGRPLLIAYTLWQLQFGEYFLHISNIKLTQTSSTT